MKSSAWEQSTDLSKALLIIPLSEHRSEAALSTSLLIYSQLLERLQHNEISSVVLLWDELNAPQEMPWVWFCRAECLMLTAVLVGREHSWQHLLPGWKKGKAKTKQRSPFFNQYSHKLNPGFSAYGQMWTGLLHRGRGAANCGVKLMSQWVLLQPTSFPSLF